MEKELDLFKFRFQQEGMDSVQMFLKLNNLTYNPVRCCAFMLHTIKQSIPTIKLWSIFVSIDLIIKIKEETSNFILNAVLPSVN